MRVGPWSAPPALSGMNRVLGAHPEATVPLSHPTRTAGGQPAPIVSTRQFGSGAAVTTDTTWHWDFGGRCRTGQPALLQLGNDPLDHP